MIKEMKESNKKLQEDLRRLSDKMEGADHGVSRQKKKKVTPSPEIRVSDKTDIFIDLEHALSLCFQNCVRKVYKSLSQEDHDLQWKIS